MQLDTQQAVAAAAIAMCDRMLYLIPPKLREDLPEQIERVRTALADARIPASPTQKDGVSRYWERYRNEQQFRIDFEEFEGDDYASHMSDSELITGVDNLAKRIGLGVNTIRQRFAHGRGRFHMLVEVTPDVYRSACAPQACTLNHLPATIHRLPR